MRVFHDEDVPADALAHETVAVIGYGNQGRAQALNLRDSSIEVVVGNRADECAAQAEHDGLRVLSLSDAAVVGTILLLLIPDEVQAEVFTRDLAPGLTHGKGVVFAHGFAVRYGLIDVPGGIDLMLLAPRLPGQYVRRRYLEGWGVPAFLAVENDASGRALGRVTGLARALGFTRCAAMEVSFADETELDHFSQHFVYPLVFRALEVAFDALVDAGYAPEAALMELYGSGELGQVLEAAADEGLYTMIRTHASPACQVGIAQHWEDERRTDAALRERIQEALAAIRDGRFARRLLREQEHGYPDLARWRGRRSARLVDAERNLAKMLRKRQ